LESLRVIEEYASGRKKITKLVILEIEELLIVSVVYNKIEQVVMTKSMVPDPEWFDSN